MVGRAGGELHLRAQIVLSQLAAAAEAACTAGLDGDGVPWLQGCYSGADGLYDTRGFVAHYQGVGWGDESFNTAMSPEMDLVGLVID